MKTLPKTNNGKTKRLNMYSLEEENGDFVCSLCKVHQIQHQELPAMNKLDKLVLVIKRKAKVAKSKHSYSYGCFQK